MRKKVEAKQEANMSLGASKMNFDAWWAITMKKLPAHHHREIVLADFKSRGVSMNETMAAYNKALELYGVKLK